MTNKELQEKLAEFPDDLAVKVWDDEWYGWFRLAGISLVVKDDGERFVGMRA